MQVRTTETCFHMTGLQCLQEFTLAVFQWSELKYQCQEVVFIIFSGILVFITKCVDPDWCTHYVASDLSQHCQVTFCGMLDVSFFKNCAPINVCPQRGMAGLP